jgi:hypothetical protein
MGTRRLHAVGGYAEHLDGIGAAVGRGVVLGNQRAHPLTW